MPCPICKKELEKAIFYGVEIDYCPTCLGVWFEEEELRWAKDEKDRNLRWLDIDIWKDNEKFKISPNQRLCPSCRMPLYQVGYGESGIFVDVCNLCRGIWLDRGEFKKIVAYLQSKAEFELFNNYAKNLKQQTWEIFIGPETFKEEVSDFLAVLKVTGYKFAAQHENIAKTISSLPK